MRTRPLTPLSISALLLLAACGGQEEDPAARRAAAVEQKGLNPRTVRVVTPQPRQVQEQVEAIGSLVPFEDATVAAEVEGVIDEVQAEVGDRVAKGAPLATVDRSTYRLRLAEAEAALDRAKAQAQVAERELERKRRLLADRTISKAAFDVVEGEADLARAGVAAAAAARDLAAQSFARSQTRAPFAGVVAGRMAERGNRVDIGAPLFRVADVSRLKLTFELPERYASRVSRLQEVRFVLPGDERPRAARRWAISPVVTRATRTVPLTFLVDNPDGELRAGSSATVLVTFPETETRFVVPRTAVTLEELPRVFVAAEGVARERVVRLGRMGDTEVELAAGVDASTQVVADATGMFDGVPIQTATGSAPPTPAAGAAR